jgi:uroporphyrinogen decarboxylase
VVSHPVEDESGLLKLQEPDPKTAGGIETAMRFSKLQEQNGGIVWFHHRSPFTMAANICGIERFARWMLRRPELCDHLIDMAFDHIFNVLDYWIHTFGSENIAVYNSSPMESNQLISPRHFERFALPAHKRYINRLNISGITRYFFHICSEQKLNLPYLSEIAEWHHPAVISIGHEVDLGEAARFFPDDVIYGNMNPQIIQSVSPQKVYEICRETLEQGRKIDTGFILALGCDLPVYTPVENVHAMKHSVMDSIS